MKWLLKQLGTLFLRGLIFLVPLAMTVWAGFYIYNLLKSLEFNGVSNIWISLAVMLGVILLFGLLMSSFLMKPMMSFLDDLLAQIPGVKLIYSPVKDFMEALVGEKRRFNIAVRVDLLPDAGAQRFGFMTQQDLGKLGMPGMVAVYIPMSYSFSGNMYLLPADRVVRLEGVDSAEMMKFILSGGVTDMDELLKKAEEKAPEVKAD